MLEESAEDRADFDRVRYAGDAGPEATSTADGQLDRNTRLRRAVERLDHERLGEGVHLGPNAGRFAALRCFSLFFDQAHERLVQRERTLQQPIELAHRPKTGELREYLVDVASVIFVLDVRKPMSV